VEYVHDDLQIIEHDPLAAGKPVDRGRFDGVPFFEAGLNLAGDRFEMRFGSPRADGEEIRESGNSAQIEDDDIFRLFVRGELGASGS
jgi:hypothetical protein